MGNSNNRDQWAARERLLFIERLAWWRGVVNRADVREVFGISAAQASADLQGYQLLNPPAMSYNVRSKRYESRGEMACTLHSPQLEDAVVLFLDGDSVVRGASNSCSRVDVFSPPARKAKAQVERMVFLALGQGRKLTIHYWSVNSSRGTRREIAPLALAHDGYRWHVRAWCLENSDFRDFVLSRIESADWPEFDYLVPRPDLAWEKEITLILKANSKLDDEQRKTIERDYGMVAGKLKVRIREAMREYYLAHLRIPVVDEDGRMRPQHLELE